MTLKGKCVLVYWFSMVILNKVNIVSIFTFKKHLIAENSCRIENDAEIEESKILTNKKKHNSVMTDLINW